MNTEKNTAEKKKTKAPNPFEGMASATGFDDWTLYKNEDFLEIQKSGKIFKGYLLGHKVTPKQGFVLYYFVTPEGECLKVFGSGNLAYQLNKIVADGHVETLVGIRYEGMIKLDVEIAGVVKKTDVNQWTVGFNAKDKVTDELLTASGALALDLKHTILEQ